MPEDAGWSWLTTSVKYPFSNFVETDAWNTPLFVILRSLMTVKNIPFSSKFWTDMVTTFYVELAYRDVKRQTGMLYCVALHPCARCCSLNHSIHSDVNGNYKIKWAGIFFHGLSIGWNELQELPRSNVSKSWSPSDNTIRSINWANYGTLWNLISNDQSFIHLNLSNQKVDVVLFEIKWIWIWNPVDSGRKQKEDKKERWKKEKTFRVGSSRKCQRAL